MDGKEFAKAKRKQYRAEKLYEDFIVLTNSASIEERDRIAKKCCFITINELIKRFKRC